jgi:FixJ family two-component response regulator
MKMPGLSGIEVLDALRRAGLTVRVILISARPPRAYEGFFATIKKPFGLDTIRRTVAAAGGAEADVRSLNERQPIKTRTASQAGAP